MSEPKVTNGYSNKKFYFMNFESREQFDKLGSEAYAEELKKGTIKPYSPPITTTEEKAFYATTDRELLDKGDFTTYIDQNIVEKSIEEFEGLFATIDMGGAFNKSRLIITDDKRGIFDFGLASQGLYRLPEYFSKELAVESPNEFFGKIPGLVPLEFIREDKMKQFWYKSTVTEKDYILELRQEGLTEILDNNPFTPLMEVSGMITTQSPTKGLKFSTHTKKSYVTFERKGGKARMVDLYVPIGGLSNLSYEGMLARALPVMLASRYFEMAGIRTRINATRMYLDLNEEYYTCFTFPLKDYGEDLDFNWIAINTADPRFFRWNMFKYTRAFLAKNFNRNFQVGAGTTVYGGDALLEVGNRYKNWYFEEMQKGLQPELSVDRNLMLFGGLQNPSNSISYQKAQIKNEFFRILDIVDFQFNSPEKASKRIYERVVEKEKKSVMDYKRYIQSIASSAYSYPSKGMYKTEQERIDILEQDYDIALDGMNNYLISL